MLSVAFDPTKGKRQKRPRFAAVLLSELSSAPLKGMTTRSAPSGNDYRLDPVPDGIDWRFLADASRKTRSDPAPDK